MSHSNRVIPTSLHSPQKSRVDFPKHLSVAVC